MPQFYEAVFSPETQCEADFLQTAAAHHGRPSTRDVLEPACGSGRLVVELARRGCRVTGFDANVEMLRYARRALGAHKLRAHLTRDCLEDFAFRRRFDMAHCLVSTFKYILDEDGARSHLVAVARHLRPRGLYILGFHLTEYGSSRRSRERWTAVVGNSRVTCNIQIWPADPRKRLERVRSRLVVLSDSGEQRYETNWQFRTYNANQVRRLLRAVPQLEHVATHDFTYDIRREIALDDRQLDVVLILRKQA